MTTRQRMGSVFVARASAPHTPLSRRPCFGRTRPLRQAKAVMGGGSAVGAPVGPGAESPGCGGRSSVMLAPPLRRARRRSCIDGGPPPTRTTSGADPEPTLAFAGGQDRGRSPGRRSHRRVTIVAAGETRRVRQNNPVRNMKSKAAPARPDLSPPPGPSTARANRRLYRDPDNRIVAGVAAGLAEHLGMRPIIVRLAFIVLLAANGLGGLLYVAFWAVLPVAGSGKRPARRMSLLQALGLAAFATGVIILRAHLPGFADDSTLIALAAVIALGAGIIWHQADPQRRRRTIDPAGPGLAPPIPESVLVAAAVPRVTEAVDSFGDRRWFPVRM